MAYTRTTWSNGDVVTAFKLNNLEEGMVAAHQTRPIEQGGTGATTAAQARNNLGAAAAVHSHEYLPLAGGTVTGSVQLGNNTTQNVNLGLVTNASGDRFNWHATSGWLMLHRQTASGTVLANPLSVDDSNNVLINPSGGYTEVLSNNVGVRVNYNAGSPVVSPISSSAAANNTVDFGTSGNRFKTLYLVNAPNVSSDARLKKDITQADNSQALAFLKALEVVSYNYTYDKEGSKKRIGIIAQNMIEADADFAPYFVDDDGSEDKILSLRSSDLVFPLIQAVQSIVTRLEALEGGVSV